MMLLMSQQPIQQWENVNPHDVPQCAIPPDAFKDPTNVAPCTCPGMVGHIQTEKAQDCWEKNGHLQPPSDVPMTEELIPLDVRICLENVPDHCQVISKDAEYHWGYKEKKNYCKTSCKPERCGCADSGCKSHQESEDY